MSIQDKSLQNLKSWQKGESGNPNGRPRKILNKLEQEIGLEFNVSLSKDDKLTVLESMIELSLYELQKIATDKDCPAFMVIIARSIHEDIKKGSLSTISELFDRFFGKPVQENKNTNTTNSEFVIVVNDTTDKETK